MTFVGWFAIVVGLSIGGLWGTLLVTRQIPEIPAGKRAIWFHLAAEFGTSALLIAAGIRLLASGGENARLLAAFALGALLYTTVNSPGYYADLGEWPLVGMFVVLAAAATVSALVLFVA